MESSEMTEREMLEFAAKAIGITLKPMEVKNVEFMGDDHFIGFMTDPAQWKRGWFDPLADDGDALRLAVKLGFCILTHATQVEYSTGGGKIGYAIEQKFRDVAATRRAITKAAAEIGKCMA